MKITRRLLRTLLLMATVGSFGALVSAAYETWDVVVTGLNNPRGLAIGPEGAVYIAEAGSGGAGPCAPGPEGERCYGETGAITRYVPRTGAIEQVVTGLPSLASGGAFATGPHHVSLQGRGNMYFTIGLGGDPRMRAAQFGAAGAAFARVGRATPDGSWRLLSNLGSFEAAANPTGDEVDSNPYGILALPGRQIVTDAGANDLLEIRENGTIRPLAVFPNSPSPWDAVPTSVALGPDGAYYVGQLTGFPFPVGGANVFRVPADGGTPQVFASGFTHIIDLSFGPDGNLYVLEIAENGLLAAFGANDWSGALIRVEPDGTRTELVDGVLFAPGGVAIDRGGTIYVTNRSIFSGSGEVIRIQP